MRDLAVVTRPGATHGTASGAASLTVTEADLDSGEALRWLVAAFRAQNPHAHSDADIASIEAAYGVARAAHAAQRRRSGEPYFVHPMRVALTIAEIGLDAVSIVAGLLHDAVEDSELTVFDVHEGFGREVASIVDGVTKLGKIPYLSRLEQQAESFRKMLLAMSDDIRVLIVKLLDRLDNMRTLDHMPRDKQERIGRETMQIYAPLAGRLGIEWVRGELQELSFRYLEPTVHAATQADIDAFVARRPTAAVDALAVLRSAFDGQTRPRSQSDEVDPAEPWPAHVLGDVEVRLTLRSPYRVHRRLEPTGRRVDQLSDVATFVIVTPSRATCYAALGQVHAQFQPVPGRFRDYIALPRPNHYQALHTSVLDRTGQRLELQIRSVEMDDVAERGIIAQWHAGPTTATEGRRLAWLGQLMDWQDEVDDPAEFIEAVKAELFADEVYVFSPGGDIFTFPKNATPIDFAFAIHTDVGMHCSGARVNGHLVPLRYRLRQGDAVEIITNPDVGPREEWLKMCVSSRGRAKIKQHLRQAERGRFRSLGRSLVDQEVASRGAKLVPFEEGGKVVAAAESLGLSKDASADTVYESVGAGQLTAIAVADRLCAGPETPRDSGLITRVLRRVMSGAGKRGDEALATEAAAPIIVTRELVEVGGGREGMVHLSGCCSPVPGDPLLGFFDAARGITAHVQGCPAALEQLSKRRIYLAWEPGLELDCPLTLEVRTGNSVGLLAEMSRAFSHHGVNIRQANCRASSDGERAVNTFHASVTSLAQLEGLVEALRGIDGVVGVERVFTAGSGVYPRG